MAVKLSPWQSPPLAQTLVSSKSKEKLPLPHHEYLNSDTNMKLRVLHDTSKELWENLPPQEQLSR